MLWLTLIFWIISRLQRLTFLGTFAHYAIDGVTAHVPLWAEPTLEFGFTAEMNIQGSVGKKFLEQQFSTCGSS